MVAENVEQEAEPVLPAGGETDDVLFSDRAMSFGSGERAPDAELNVDSQANLGAHLLGLRNEARLTWH